ncbi:MAG: hypothetical protein IPO62_00305 [Saprospiraceae bacterium]|nr:hypothetical protein [Saprospiraceae bacterium]
MPIRIETRFLTYDGDPKKYLGVRFIPDDIFVDTHETILTSDENEAGKNYWSKIGDPENDRLTNYKKEWRVLNSLYGSNRAAYIVLKTKPLNWPADDSEAIPSDLQYPPFTLSKDNSWSLPARSYVVPDKFVVRLQNGTDVIERESKPVHAYPLILGPDPNSEEDLFEEDEDGNLSMDGRIRWLYDFDAAVANGMAVKIEITNAQYNSGFDKITVLGLRLSADQHHSQQLLEGLVDSHHYGQNGFGIVPQGTPTNNSKDKPSGYSQLRQDPTFSFQTEQESPLIGPLDISNKFEWKDGQWLAYGLGIGVDTFAHTYFANHTDRIEATAMNEALWHGTLGYYFKHMLVTWNTLSNDTLSISDIANLKEFFTAYISGRGPLPAIRVGNQPYGVLPITAYSKMVWENADSVPKKLQPVLNFFKESWRRKLGNVKTTSQGSDNWQQDFLDILGLQSGSVEYYNRLGIGPLVYYMYLKQTPNNADLWLDNQVIQSSQTNASINNLISDADLLFKNTRASMLSWFPFQSRIKNGIVTQDPISEEISLSNDYIAYLSDPSNIEIIIQEYIDQNLYDGSLLYGMLRHSFLLIVWEILWKKFHGGEWIEKELLNTEIEEACKAVWYQYINTKERSELISYIKEDSTYVDYTTSLKKLSHESLGSIPTERLERLLSEHLDLCSYRFDAWQTGLVDYKLQKMRTSTPNGCYLGAYGWVLNVRKDPPRTVVPNSQIPSLFTNDNEIHKLTFDAGNAGFIHAPSIAQATTSAVLREGYLSKGKEQMQVDLTSRRVRLAKEIIQGIQNGQELGALLGYRFERSLHDKSGNGLELDKYIYELRTKLPLVTRKENDAMENFEANQVVHGLDLLTRYRNQITFFDFITDSIHKQNILLCCKDLDEIIDAISDLTMAEGVHQAVLGNHVRANAILNSIGEGKNIPEPQFIETPRTGITLTQRMGVLFNADDIDTEIWSSNQTYRSKVSPQINWWIGKILGDGNKIKCKVTYQISKDPDMFESEIVTPINLGLQPIDFVILLNNPLNDTSSELSQRILYHIRKTKNLTKEMSILINFENKAGFATNERSFIEVLSLSRNIYRLMTDSEIMLPTHLQRDSEMIQISDSEEFDLASYNGMINLLTLKSDLTSIKLLLTSSNTESNFDNLRAKLLELSELDIQGCISTDPNG